MTFNIGSQHGVINNVAGNQTIHGGQGHYLNTADLVTQLRDELARTALPSHALPAVRREFTALEAESKRPDPNQRSMAGHLGRLVGVLKSTGALASTSTGLINSLNTLRTALGPWDEPIRHVLGL